jgi:hypothetical protein
VRGQSVTALASNGISSWAGEMAGNGRWEVSGGANAVCMEHRVNGSLRSLRGAHQHLGFLALQHHGHHLWLAHLRGEGLPHGHRQLRQPHHLLGESRVRLPGCHSGLPTASISCSRPLEIINCTGTASDGTCGYTQFWKEQDDTSASPWYQGVWTASFSYPMKTLEHPYNATLLIQFKIRDCVTVAGWGQLPLPAPICARSERIEKPPRLWT